MAPPTLTPLVAPRAPQEWEYLLEELALYFLMYSEGANLRHTPEALWFIFWCLRNSYDRQLQITVPPPSDPRSAAKVGTSRGGGCHAPGPLAAARHPACAQSACARARLRGANCCRCGRLLLAACTPELARDLMKQRIHLRSKYQRLIADLRQEHGVKADGEMRTVSELVGRGGGVMWWRQRQRRQGAAAPASCSPEAAARAAAPHTALGWRPAESPGHSMAQCCGGACSPPLPVGSPGPASLTNCVAPDPLVCRTPRRRPPSTARRRRRSWSRGRSRRGGRGR
jgi:hypothetical protein